MDFDQFVGFVNEGANQDVFMFFLIGFGRIDYGIKCQRSFVVNGKIKWEKFSAALPGTFFEDGRFAEKQFSQNPPAMWAQSRRRFEDAQQITNTVELIKGLNRFRNNLFHGSKGKLRERDHVLCHDALNIVRAIYEVCLLGNEPLNEIARWAADVDGRYRDSNPA